MIPNVSHMTIFKVPNRKCYWCDQSWSIRHTIYSIIRIRITLTMNVCCVHRWMLAGQINWKEKTISNWRPIFLFIYTKIKCKSIIIVYFLPLTTPCNVALSFPNMGVTITLSAFDNKHLLLYHFTFQSGLQWPIRYGMPSVKIETRCDITVFRRLRLNPWHSNSVSSPRLRIALSIFLLYLAAAFRLCKKSYHFRFWLSFLNCKSLFPKQFDGPATEICRPLL